MWNLYFNVSKCKVKHVGKRNPEFEYTMKFNNDVQRINSWYKEKDLGVTFDKMLSFDPHIKIIVNKAKLNKENFFIFEQRHFVKLYKATSKTSSGVWECGMASILKEAVSGSGETSEEFDWLIY